MSLDVEKPQRREAVIHGTRRQLLLLKQLSLVFTNLSQAQTVRRSVESSREIFDCAEVIPYGIFQSNYGAVLIGPTGPRNLMKIT